MRLCPRWAVDLLPIRLWEAGNTFRTPGGDWHFCVKPNGEDQTLRTIEWRGREVASGRRGLDIADHRD
jgi:hypothetical protein